MILRQAFGPGLRRHVVRGLEHVCTLSWSASMSDQRSITVLAEDSSRKSVEHESQVWSETEDLGPNPTDSCSLH